MQSSSYNLEFRDGSSQIDIGDDRRRPRIFLPKTFVGKVNRENAETKTVTSVLCATRQVRRDDRSCVERIRKISSKFTDQSITSCPSSDEVQASCPNLMHTLTGKTQRKFLVMRKLKITPRRRLGFFQMDSAYFLRPLFE